MSDTPTQFLCGVLCAIVSIVLSSLALVLFLERQAGPGFVILTVAVVCGLCAIQPLGIGRGRRGWD